MSYTVGPGDIFGRMGSGFGQGLAEQLPKEIERNRLSSGLKDLEQNSNNLSPLQQYTRLAAIPGITPQMIQTFGELSKQQNLRNAYQQRAGRNRQEMPKEDEGKSFSSLNVNFPGQDTQTSKMGDQIEPSEKYGQPQVVDKNPLRQEAIPKAPWTPDRRNQEIANISEEFPNLPFPEVASMAADNEQRELAQPGGEQAVDQYQKQVQDELDKEFTNQLETKLQKTDKGVYQDITGENLINLKRGMERDLRTNPKATVKDVADKWSKKALDLAKTKSQMKKLSAENLAWEASPFKRGSTLEKLKGYQKIFADSGNSEEFFNTLKSSQDNGGFDMSPQGAASIAYPRSPGVKEYVDSVKPNPSQNSRKHASEIEKRITAGDSLLAIARDLHEKDPRFFSQRDFFDQIRDDIDNIPLNSRQRREVAEGANTDILKTWGDMWILPWR